MADVSATLLTSELFELREFKDFQGKLLTSPLAGTEMQVLQPQAVAPPEFLARKRQILASLDRSGLASAQIHRVCFGLMFTGAQEDRFLHVGLKWPEMA